MKHHLLPSKELVDLFERQITCFRVEEIDQWEEAGVEHAEVYICAPADAIDADRSDFDDEESEYPI